MKTWLSAWRRSKQVSAREGKSPEEVPIREKRKTRLERIRERFPSFRFISTSLGGLNMPKRQPCPVCGKGSKRREKTMGGANYHCPRHGLFFVRA